MEDAALKPIGLLENVADTADAHELRLHKVSRVWLEGNLQIMGDGMPGSEVSPSQDPVYPLRRSHGRSTLSRGRLLAWAVD
jgi:hypothetical protein